MKVLWITNIVFPEALALLGENSEFNESGGWLIGGASEIIRRSDLQLIVASVSKRVKDLKRIIGKGIIYYLIPMGRGNEFVNNEYEKYWKIIKAEEKPDLVHIHGTEYSHGLSYIRSCTNRSNIIISIQGLTSVIEHYFFAGLSYSTVLRNLTIHDLLVGGMLSQKKAMRRRGRFEIEMIQSVSHVIGRTSFDKSHIEDYNPSVHYHFCNETLRPEFYSGRWSYSKCKPFSIFLSQASQPYKGAHILFRALSLIKVRFPNVTVRIAGFDVSQLRSIKDLKYYTGYGRYLKKLCKEYHLEDCITYLGQLNGDCMKQEYLSSNVFVCPSSIENSPNSLCEAQLLGVPCVASYVGGIPDLIPNQSMGFLYCFDDFVMLAKIICDVFLQSPEYENAPVIEMANKRHDQKENYNRLIDIYSSVIGMMQNNSRNV